MLKDKPMLLNKQHYGRLQSQLHIELPHSNSHPVNANKTKCARYNSRYSIQLMMGIYLLVGANSLSEQASGSIIVSRVPSGSCSLQMRVVLIVAG